MLLLASKLVARFALSCLYINLYFFLFQVLFKNLGLELKEITPTSLLKDRKREMEGNPDFSNKDIGASQPQIVAEVKSGIISPLNQVELSLEVAPSSNSGGHTHLLSQVCNWFTSLESFFFLFLFFQISSLYL